MVLINTGIKRLRLQKRNDDIIHSFSIIVAARNEEDHIGDLLESFTHIEYSNSHFEVIIVDDASSDDTANIIAELAQRRHYLSELEQLGIFHGN